MVVCHVQAGCREAVLAYLWTLVGVNEGRTAGGEKGVLKEEATSGGLFLCIACSLAYCTLQLRQLRKSATQYVLDNELVSAWYATAEARHKDWLQPADCGQACELLWKMQHSNATVAGCSDGLAVGTSALCLRFCRPFLGGEEKFMARLDPGFYSQQAFRHAALPMALHHWLATRARAFSMLQWSSSAHVVLT